MKIFAVITLTLLLPEVSRSQTSAPAQFGIQLERSVYCTAVKDQAESPTCWVFGTNSLFESDINKRSGVDLDLSEMFIARYAYLDKARQFLATGGKTYFEGGGQFHDVLRVIRRYGMVPEIVYPGLRDANGLHNHAKLDTIMNHVVHGYLRQKKYELSAADVNELNGILDMYLGKVPKKFTYNGKVYTPKSFSRDFLRVNADDYLDIVSFDDHQYYKKFMLNDKYNWAFDSLFNLPLLDLLTICDTAIAGGYTVGWEGDVTNGDFHYRQGVAWLSDTVHQYVSERVADYASEETERDHMLHMTGIATDSTGSKWYYLKNSWNSNSNELDGFMYMRQDYFKLRTVIIMVNKNALPVSIRKKMGI